MRYVLVGGDWNDAGGRPSGFVARLGAALAEITSVDVTIHNGGFLADLHRCQSSLNGYDAILWLANVPNDKEKVRDIKALYPHTLLVMSKRNNDEYEFRELINRALGHKANLMIDFRRDGAMMAARLFDPLGCVWCDHTTDIPLLASRLHGRLSQLAGFTRQGVLQASPDPLTVPDQPEFFALVKAYAETFHDLILPEQGVTRFLGNCSFRSGENFRCTKGFPSFRSGEHIYVSRRNIDKRFIGQDGFVATDIGTDDTIRYWGPHKPSVDTPVQLRLYRAFPSINFMVHAHVYVADAPFTVHPIPCGALEEVGEILAVIDPATKLAAINLIGHGCLLMAAQLSDLHQFQFVSRPTGEQVTP
jgi:hypothetical protein